MNAITALPPALPIVRAGGATIHTASAAAHTRPTIAWHIDCVTGRPVARWLVLPLASPEEHAAGRSERAKDASGRHKREERRLVWKNTEQL
jgi:hypothetical protein